MTNKKELYGLIDSLKNRAESNFKDSIAILDEDLLKMKKVDNDYITDDIVTEALDLMNAYESLIWEATNIMEKLEENE